MYSYLIKSRMAICVFVWLSKDSSADVCSRAETWSTFLGSFRALSDHEEYRVTLRTLPSYNGTLNLQFQDINTLNCDEPKCPPQEGVVSEYNHGNRTLFISFQPGEPGNIAYTMLFRSSIGQHFRMDLGTATNGTLDGVEPGNYNLSMHVIVGRELRLHSVMKTRTTSSSWRSLNLPVQSH
ncbi:hypothetical protein MAR_008997 [Mya arenaria]|uniref:Secreted protein n=1 Tax=Mya arenaria TaxID=6604 RepID=A0ABY7DZJ1_MYAAR|nr:hypothetical protein MAR_008997 [Mya arenaria]